MRGCDISAELAAPPEPDQLTEDGQLVEEFLDGDLESFAALYRKYYPALVSFHRHRLHDPNQAEDAAHETAIRMFRYLKSFDCSRPMWPWLKMVATYVAAHWGEDRVNGGDAVDLSTDSQAEPLLEDFAPSVCERPLVVAALRCLSPRHRLALVLRYIEGWETDDIARRLGLNRNALEQCLFRARNRFRREYERLSVDGRLSTIPLLGLLRRFRDRAAHLYNNSQVGEALSAPGMALTGLAVAAVTISLGVGFAGDAGEPPARALDVEPPAASVQPPAAAARVPYGARERAAPAAGGVPAQLSTGPVTPAPSGTIVEAAPLGEAAEATITRDDEDGKRSIRLDHAVDLEPYPYAAETFATIDCEEGMSGPAACDAWDDADEVLADIAPGG